MNIEIYPNTMSLAGNALHGKNPGSWAVRQAKDSEAPNKYMLSMIESDGKPHLPTAFKSKNDLVNFLAAKKDVYKPDMAISCIHSGAAEIVNISYLSEKEKINEVVNFLKDYTSYQWEAGMEGNKWQGGGMVVSIIDPDPGIMLGRLLTKEDLQAFEARQKANQPFTLALEKAEEICKLADVRLDNSYNSKSGVGYYYFEIKDILSIYNQLDQIKEGLSMNSAVKKTM